MRICAPRTNPPKEVVIEDPSWYKRRVLRSLKNVFQSKCLLAVWDVDLEEGGLSVVEAWRIVCEDGDLNMTFFFADGTWIRRVCL